MNHLPGWDPLVLRVDGEAVVRIFDADPISDHFPPAVFLDAHPDPVAVLQILVQLLVDAIGLDRLQREPERISEAVHHANEDFAGLRFLAGEEPVQLPPTHPPGNGAVLFAAPFLPGLHDHVIGVLVEGPAIVAGHVL